MKVENIYSAIIRQAGIRIETIQSESSTMEGTVTTRVGFKAKIPWFETKAEGEVATTAGSQTALTTEFVSFDFGESQSVAELLTQAAINKFIVLENFHYLSDETQRSIAFGLKTFHEVGIRCIILGIWRESDHLLTYNNDLQDRIIEIPVEPWQNTDFDRVIIKGCEALNVTIATGVVELIKKNAYGSIGMLQEFLKEFCIDSGVMETGTVRRSLEDVSLAEATLKNRLEKQRTQLVKALQAISARSRIRSNEPDPLLLPYYLALVILETPVKQLQEGIERSRLLDLIRKEHRREDKETIRTGDVTNLLQGLPRLQKSMHPALLYYDPNSRRIRIVDPRQFFVFANCRMEELKDEIPFPLAHRFESDTDECVE